MCIVHLSVTNTATGRRTKCICLSQIGNRFALTAAHCLYDDDNEEELPASSFSILLGLHNRREIRESNRYVLSNIITDIRS